MPLELNGTTGVQGNSGAFVAGTAVASTSGTSIDFTSIPSWVKRVTVCFNQVSTNGGSVVIVQIGSGSFTTSGYVGSASYNAPSVGVSNFTTGFPTSSNAGAGFGRNGMLVMTTLGSNLWVSSCTLGMNGAAETGVGGGSVTLGGTLDRVRITTVNGTDAFDAGSLNILYE